ncbi:MAG: hypothetical protein KIT27_11735 [Legionellales bacterium]|nr:hypothetical protein [Legionellales bacterium]
MQSNTYFLHEDDGFYFLNSNPIKKNSPKLCSDETILKLFSELCSHFSTNYLTNLFPGPSKKIGLTIDCCQDPINEELYENLGLELPSNTFILLNIAFTTSKIHKNNYYIDECESNPENIPVYLQFGWDLKNNFLTCYFFYLHQSLHNHSSGIMKYFLTKFIENQNLFSKLQLRCVPHQKAFSQAPLKGNKFFLSINDFSGENFQLIFKNMFFDQDDFIDHESLLKKLTAIAEPADEFLDNLKQQENDSLSSGMATESLPSLQNLSISNSSSNSISTASNLIFFSGSNKNTASLTPTSQTPTTAWQSSSSSFAYASAGNPASSSGSAKKRRPRLVRRKPGSSLEQNANPSSSQQIAPASSSVNTLPNLLNFK